MSGITFRSSRARRDVEAVVAFHREVYRAEWNFDERFVAHVEAPLAAFARAGSARDRLWLAELDGRLVGCIAIVAAAPGVGQLRWFLVAPEARSAGLGRRLMAEALGFCREQGHRSVILWTVDLLEDAARLYRAHGFRRVERRPGAPWGVPLVEERYELALDAPPGSPGGGEGHP